MWQLVQRVLAALLLLALSPLIVAVALFIRNDSAGPILYRARRVGLGGREIWIHKFRSMRWDPKGAGPGVTYRDDPRITGAGRFVRRTRLDELPQLWDVARGVMSLVGPRPEAPEFVDLRDARWREVLSVRPGIAGSTQLEYLDEALDLDGADPATTYRTAILPRKLESDLQYVRHRTPLGDVLILLKTARLLLTHG